MKRMKINILACSLAAILFQITTGRVEAQNDTTKSVYNESVVVVGDYNPVLDGITNKYNVAPAINENVSDELQPRFTYSITPTRLVAISPTTGPKSRKVDVWPTLYNNYLKLGIGHDFASFADINPLVDLYFTSKRNDVMSYGARFYHQVDVTTFGKEDETAPSPDHYGRNRMADTKFDIFGKYILDKKHLFEAALSFDREYGRYYGFNDSILQSRMGFNRDSISFSDYAFAYNNIALNLGAKSLNTDVNKFGYEANVSMADMWGRYDFSQLSMNLDGNVHYGFPMFSKYKAIAYLHANWQGYRHNFDTPQSVADLPLGYDATLPLPDSISAGRHLLTINPYVDFLFNGIKFHAGLAMGFNGYDDPESTSHNLFPDLSVAKSFSNNAMSLVAGFRGDYKANDWNTIRHANPFVGPAPQSLAMVDNNLYAHLRVNFSKRLMLNVAVDNHFFKNYMFFRIDRSYVLGNVFQPYYVDVNMLDFSADFTFVNDEMITMTLGGMYSADYGVPDNTVMLYEPDFIAHLDAAVNYKDKFFFTFQTLFMTRVDADYETNPVTGLNTATVVLPARFGVSLEAEYVHNKALSFFAKFDNLTFQRYWFWANYPAPRFNAMVGLTYTLDDKKFKRR